MSKEIKESIEKTEKNTSTMKQAKQIINGVEYTFQKIHDVRAALQMKDRMQGENGVDSTKMADELFEHVVVNPKVKIEDFSEAYEVEELALAAYEFQFPRPKRRENKG